MDRQKSEKDKELADNARLVRAWRRWHAEQLQEALTGIHADVMRRLMAQLKDLHSARALIDHVANEDWSLVDDDTRAIALREINAAITTLREHANLEPIGDPLPGERENAFRIIKQITLLTRSSGGLHDLARATPKLPRTGNRPGVPVKQDTQS